MAAVINSQILFIRSIWTWMEFLGEVDIFLTKKTDVPGFFQILFQLTDLKKLSCFGALGQYSKQSKH